MIKKTLEQITIDYLNNPMIWPHLVLPLKGPNHTSAYTTGALEDGSFRVYDGNIFAITKEDKCAVYPDAYAVVRAGWRVD